MKRTFIFVIILLSAILGYILFDWYMQKVFAVICEEECKRILNKCLNDAAYDVIKSGITYEDLITIKQDGQGNIVLVQSNTIRMNTLAGEVSNVAEYGVESKSKSGILIPFGYLVGGQLFSEKLPEIPVSFRQIGNVTTGFSSQFQSAGINQTMHTVNLDLSLNAVMMIPGYNKDINVKVTIPVCETIIVGKVPDDYMNWNNLMQ